MDKIIAKPWLSLQCEMIPGVRHAVFAADAEPGGAFATLETWPEGASAPDQVLATLRAAVASEGVEIRAPDTDNGVDAAADAHAPSNLHWIIACPLRCGGAVCGGVAVEVGGLDAAQVPVVTQLMKWGSAWPAFLADQDEARRSARVEPLLSVIGAALEPEDFRAATAAAASEVARVFEARRAAIGVHHSRGVRVSALSRRAVFDRRSERVRRIEAAMNEACDQNTTLLWPVPGDAPARVSEAHAQLSAGTDDGCVCTVPLLVRGQARAALCLMRPRSRPFDAAEIAHIESLAALLGPALETRRRADYGAVSRAVDSASQFLRRLLGPRHLRLKVSSAIGVALIAFLAFASGTHHLPAAAVLEGSVERELVAPIDGFVATALVRAGARISAGETLATLDDEALQLERRRLQSERDELANEHDRALGALDRSATRVLQAQMAQAETRLAVIEGELARTRIVAPFDGLVVSGDLSRSLGSPVSKGDTLFRLAPLDGYRVILQVEEGDVPAVRAGIGGQLLLAALPGKRFDVRVDRVNGMARSVDGRNVLEVEAALDGASEHLRPGMKGAVRLDAGRERLLWIWSYRLLDRLRLWLWAWSPVVAGP